MQILFQSGSLELPVIYALADILTLFWRTKAQLTEKRRYQTIFNLFNVDDKIFYSTKNYIERYIQNIGIRHATRKKVTSYVKGN